MKNRQAIINRNTGETSVSMEVNLDNAMPIEVNTGIGYLDHMLTLLAVHGRFSLQINAQGDLDVDSHHTVEDVGIVLGQAILQALGDKTGIERYGNQVVPMDEALVRVVIDLSGRSYLVFQSELTTPQLGALETETIPDFWQAFADNLRANVHITELYGRNTHHKIEAMFKATGRALRQAVTINPDIKGVNSSKGLLA
ncbi:imidazoleglycerol-phosphate dehydratase HisB [Weissella confusa]|uniref:Imidazoleglycerol-phosphate dehydratase n=1 Tax=Weissella confusa TaxID=1583 RepID=A0AAJ2YWS6_WEICO|nr:imidazoleglycerol-phosphate dehydratase HisB [Weissella confusa]MBJ7693899.1 imidazoleglycerol-phosphate dehydratase HisB [Weissella confusa]NBA11152.1 imidazoleglycerol-phosphate dehydratase HisB [Weissella confusa]QBZ05604.1 imidazoleglycerol-phosphate dehydratase HisB [Weissella confusa]